MWARWIFACVDLRRPRRRQRQADRSQPECRFELSKQKAALRDFETKPKFEDAEPFGELACASLVLLRVKASIVEGPMPLLSIGAWRNDQPRLGRLARARQTQHPCKETGKMTTTVFYPEAATGVHRRRCGVDGADWIRELQP